MAIRDRLRNQQFEAMLFSNRILMAGFVVFILVSTLLFRLYQLQYVGYGHYSGLSKNNRVRLMSVPPARGLIFDRNGEIIANNFPSFQLEITPEIVKDIPATIEALQQFIPISASEIKHFNRALKRKRRFEGTPLKFNLNDDQVAKISVNLHQFPGIAVKARLSRYYPLKEQATHTIGYVGRINEKELKEIDTSNYSGTTHIGKTGVERYYENQLHGTVGYQQVEVNVEGRILHILDEIPAIPGKNLYLTLDIGLQGVAEKAMKN
jgi:penicillin-binding protein 2